MSREWGLSVAKIMGKTAIWAFSCFYSPPTLNNVEKQRAELPWSYAMVLQHSIKWDGDFLNIIFRIPIIFCHWLSEIYKKKERGGSIHVVSNNSNLL